MAKHATTPTPPPAAPSKPWLKLALTLAVLAALVYVARLIVLGIQDAMQSTRQALEKQGVSVSKDGVAVKTEKRALTQEETEERLQRGLMKGWKNSQFNVPWMLAKTTGLGGSRHDKNKDEWEKKYGPKQKRRVD